MITSIVFILFIFFCVCVVALHEISSFSLYIYNIRNLVKQCKSLSLSVP